MTDNGTSGYGTENMCGEADPEVPALLQQLLDQLPKQVDAFFRTPNPNAQIKLYEGPATVSINGTHVASATATILLCWLPTPTLWYTVRLDEGNKSTLAALVADGAEMAISFDEFPGTTETSKISGLAAIGLLNSQHTQRFAQGFSHGGTKPLKRVVFHVANCILFSGEAVGKLVQKDGRFEVIGENGRCKFSACGWSVILDRTPEAGELALAMGEEPGYGLTHVGELTRDDASPFTGGEAKQFLEDLAYLLSFCSGRWCGPLLAYGFDASGERVWLDWHVGRLDPWKMQQIWFPFFDSRALPGLAPNFLVRLADPIWNKPLRLATSWYLDSLNPSTVDTGIILGQVGLELVAWTQMVYDTKEYTTSQFRTYSAALKIEYLLKHAKVTTDIPPSYAGLTEYAALKQKRNGPEVYAALRNALVHGSDVQTYLGIGGDARIEAWLLGLSYLELAILNVTGYVGVYCNRIVPSGSGAAFEPVPWAVAPLTGPQN